MNGTALNWLELCRTVGPCLRPGGTALTDRALEVCNLSADSLIADVGCGAGGTLYHLEQIGFRRLVGLDPSETLLGDAAPRLETARLIRGEAATIPLRSATVDLLLCECVLSVLPGRSAPLREFARVVKDGGYLVVSDVFSTAGDEATGQAGGLLTRKELLAAVAGNGFTLLRWETHDRLLKEFAVRMILAGECLPDAWKGGTERKGEAARGGLGYFLMVARKAEDPLP
ncbi:Methyltransferase type 11 [Geobacter metallireducens RCH3]|uniref:SAM-dependent methyltransferase, type 11 n=1 Tax=Geobacter metallireducens (strain ATCC 53774 / DSM 7210 / GS-15) TaxID=269799 RepID=Q39UN9_GEOMG|nr:class I SAM-dependent methyltransferase [Geobacter metallireducens]ABB32035.1 SAM-dependent methyltransferase, type 11 [Geobacter metallireducens GS-15]EHP88778.1 Methyltransferase type 11 [Geobacter metallireducens RCH3]